MKKIIGLSLILMILSAAASAQVNYRKQRARNCARNQISVGERIQLRQDVVRYRALQRKAKRDAVVTPVERMKIQRAKREIRRDAFRFRHNNRRRLI